MDGERQGTEAELALDDIDPRPGNRNPRNIDELAESMRREGQLNAILVRKKGKRYELIAGERRCAAAEKAGLFKLRARVVEADDAKAELLAAIDNLDREDLSPLEEADVYQRLLDKRIALDPSDLALRVGRPSTHVRQRLRLAKLEPRIRKLLELGQLDVGAALLVAQTPSAVQKRVAPELEKAAKGQVEVFSARAEEFERPPAGRVARSTVSQILTKHSHRLAEAPFDITDATLLPKAGACGTCPKRTGTQGALLEVLDEADVCLDDECWAGKSDSTWSKKSAEAKAMGLRVLSDTDAKKMLAPEGDAYHHAPLVALSETIYDGQKHVPVAKLIEKDAPRTLARAPETGKTVELVSRKDVEAALKARTKAKTSSGGSAKREESAYQRDERNRRKKVAVLKRSQRLALKVIAEAVRSKKVDLVEAIAIVISKQGDSVWEPVCKRRGLEAKAKSNGGIHTDAVMEEATRLIDETKGGEQSVLRELVALLCEGALSGMIETGGYSGGDQRTPGELARFGVDLAALRGAAKAELAAEANEPKKPAKKRPSLNDKNLAAKGGRR